MSRVDVIVPCYNYGRYLTECVESILHQEGVDVRVLIIDDCSTDDSAAVAATLADRDDRVECRRHSMNKGHIATYNEGLDWVSGDYVLLISADDHLVPDRLRYSVQLMDSNPNVGLSYGRQILFDSSSAPRTPETPNVDSWRVVRGNDFVRECCRTAGNPVPTPCALARAAVHRQLGHYRADLPHSADMELWLRFAAVGDVGIIDVEQAYKRTHASNMQHEYVRNGVGDLLQRRAAFDSFFGSMGQRIRDLEELRGMARRNLALDAFWQGSAAFDRGDFDLARELIDLSASIDPTLRSTTEWRRYRIKRSVGPGVWKILRPWRDRLHGSRYAPTPSTLRSS